MDTAPRFPADNFAGAYGGRDLPYLPKWAKAKLAVAYVMKIENCNKFEALRQLEAARFDGQLRVVARYSFDPWREDSLVHTFDLERLWPNPTATLSVAEPAPAEGATDGVAADGIEAESRIYHTGVPGKPTSWSLIEAECRHRYNAGERHVSKGGAQSPSEWARILLHWLQGKHPSAPRPTLKTLSNNLSPLLSRLRANSPDP